MQVIERPDAEFLQVFKSCKLTLTDENEKKKIFSVAKLWLDRTDRPIKAKLAFLGNSLERSLASADNEVLSCFTGLRFDSTSPIPHDVAAAHPGVMVIHQVWPNGCV